MKEPTCAACDCALDANVVKVRIRDKIVEVCCEECAQKLREATTASTYQGGLER